jgi:hypothetical protein
MVRVIILQTMLIPLAFGILRRLAILELVATIRYFDDDHDVVDEEQDAAMILLFNEVF